MTLFELYKWQSAEGEKGENARALLTQTHWFTFNSVFDPRTGEALPQVLSVFLAKVAWSVTAGTRFHDRLWRITEHARPSVERLFRALSESPRREQALLPVRAVRELDANSFIKLSNRPGRNIREKLAGKPYLQGVRRFQSVNLPENRLLKAFVTRLEELLELRQDCLGEVEDGLLSKIQLWLRTDETQAIARWDNLPPNNTLLSHRDYRRVWDAWRRLQTLDDDIARDFAQLEVRAETMRLWNKYGRMYFDETYTFGEMPVLFSYDDFVISPWVSKLAIKRTKQRVARSFDREEIFDPVCVDLASLRPRYATTTESSESMRDTYLWQEWNNVAQSVDIELFNSDAAYLHNDATSISSTDLFYSKDNSLENRDRLDRAARAFSSKLREIFKNDVLIWLVPDSLNDFELGITRRNINARFPNAEPVPRSVAAVFEQVDYSQSSSDGFSIIVVDTIGGITCVTKLIARFDPELKKRLSETNGIYWERCPPVIVSHGDTENVDGKKRKVHDIITVDAEGHWPDQVQTQEKKPPIVDLNNFKHDSRFNLFTFGINLTQSPVAGGIRLHALQQRAGNIPLWRDQIPELSIKVKMNKGGPYQRFHLVSRGTTVEPIRGLSVTIPVHENFTLPAGKESYKFALFIGENADELGFSARLDSTAFPLKTDAVCKLSLTFEYGTDEPYKLIFTPLDKSFSPVRATLPRNDESNITDAPAPEYPKPLSWADLSRAPKPDSNQVRDLLEWLESAIDMLDKDLIIRPRKRTLGLINSYWHQDNYGNNYTFAECNETKKSVFIHENQFVAGFDYFDFTYGDSVSFELEVRNGKFTAFSVSKTNYQEEVRIRNFDDNALKNLCKNIGKRLYVPFIQIWRDGRSVIDKECPEYFVKEANRIIEYLTDLLRQDGIPQPVKNQILFLLACLHKDTTADCIQWLTEQVENGSIRDPRAVGFALGDVTEGWQQYLFGCLAAKPNNSAISVCAYAIWREQHFVESFSISELQVILNALSQRLANTRLVKLKGDEKKDKWTIRNWARATAEPLELLLGLLRTRASTNQEIKMLLQPHQEITKELAKQVDRVAEIVAQSNVDLFSRVQLNVTKPADDRTPDLLYALRLYLSGDDGANAIHITSVSDND